MRVLVTGALGGVGGVISSALTAAGHEVTRTDRSPRSRADQRGRYAQSDLNLYGEAAWLCQEQDAVVHAAAIPDPTQHSPQTVFSNNVLTTYNMVEAAKNSLTVKQFIFISSETVLGFHYGNPPSWPAQLPIDESSPTRPNDPYGLSKIVGERILEAAAQTGQLTGASLRPGWVQYPETYRAELGPIVADASAADSGLWCYTDADDLADAVDLALRVDLQAHEVFFVVNSESIGGHDVAAAARMKYGIQIEPGDMTPGRSAISSRKAEQMLGWSPRRSWRDFMD